MASEWGEKREGGGRGGEGRGGEGTRLEENARIHDAADAFAGRARKVVEALLSEKSRAAFRMVIFDQWLRTQQVLVRPGPVRYA